MFFTSCETLASQCFHSLAIFSQDPISFPIVPVWLQLWKNPTSVFVTDRLFLGKKGENLNCIFWQGERLWTEELTFICQLDCKCLQGLLLRKYISINVRVLLRSEFFYLLFYSVFDFLEKSLERRPTFVVLWYLHDNDKSPSSLCRGMYLIPCS